MIVYRDQKQVINVPQSLQDLRTTLNSSELKHDQTIAALIEFGELEAGVMDAVALETDAETIQARTLRQAALALGHLVYHSWHGTDGVELWKQGALQSIFSIQSLSLPEVVSEGVPEGYAYYGVYPEGYLESARRFFEEVHPPHVVAIGLRNIGTSLSAIVGATLEELGSEVDTYTVRPRGHPFDRRLRLSKELEQEWQQRINSFFLIVDEGPGLSGSSLTSVAEKLSDLGVPDDRIIFFPSWIPVGSPFISSRARERWSRHSKYTTGFETLWIESGRLDVALKALPCGCDDLDLLSAGQWRALFYPAEPAYPPVQPQHERHKYLCLTNGAGVLLKFVGLGRYGQAALERAERLADAGFAPRPLGLTDGLLAMEFTPGIPLTTGAGDRQLLDRLAAYMAFVDRTFPVDEMILADSLFEMIRVNVMEGLGHEWLAYLEKLHNWSILKDGRMVALDARMLPHEWLNVGGRYLKVDGTDHQNDHFFPGPQNSAWDVAGTCIEFGLAPAKREYLIGRYASLSDDRGIYPRLPYYSIAYLAFRLGYSRMAARVLDGTRDGERFSRRGDWYATQLKGELEQSAR